MNQYDKADMLMHEKVLLHKWQQLLYDQPGVTGSMVNSLEMIIKFLNEILKEKDI